MTDIDPLWHSTQDENVHISSAPAKAAGAAGQRVPVQTASFSRLPGALLGILAVSAIGYVVVMQGFSFLQGDITPKVPKAASGTVLEIHITAQGMNPQHIRVAAGQRIAWTNDQDTPQILQSDTLRDASGATLYTTPIFRGARQIFRISPVQMLGLFTYVSLTSQNLTGEVEVVASGALLTQSGSAVAQASGASSSPRPSSASSSATMVLVNVVTEGGQQSSVAKDVAIASQDALIPYNPYTVGNSQAPGTVPNADAARAIAAAHASSAPSDEAPVLHASRVPRQPESGPEVWVAFVASLAFLALVTRRHFA